MKTRENPLFNEPPTPTADLESIAAPTVFHRKQRPTHRRTLRDARRMGTAAEAIAGFDRDTQIVGFTKGAFSVIDLIRATLAVTGPAELHLSTWTAAKQSLTDVLEFVRAGLVTDARWLVDLSFQRRSPQLAHAIREMFGADAIRVARNHAKFALVTNGEWKVVLQTSMNLNHCPRFENFSIAHDPELHSFFRTILDEIWRRQPREIANAKPYDIHRHFASDL